VQEIRAQGGAAIGHVADISTSEGAESLMARCVEAFGRVDGLVNNAGLFHMALPEQEKEADIRRLLEVNVIGSILCGQAAWRYMRAQGKGAIVNVTSGAHTGISGMSVYGASKGAVASLTYGWSIDMCPHGTRVNAVSPIAQSRMNDSIRSFLQDHGRPQWSALPPPSHNVAVIAYLLSDLSEGVNGQVVRIDQQGMSIMSHPAIFNRTAAGKHATVQEVADAFDKQLRAQLVPCGVAAIQGEVRRYEMHFDERRE
jgi:NAD(P)-dependent dehydrogenase (short-subunit alcohol dehydrogenase family)